MRRALRLVPPLAVLAALVAAAPAGAKEISSLTLCGAHGACHRVHGAAARQALMQGGVLASAPDRRAPFYSLVAKVSEPGGGENFGFTVRWVPSAGRIRATGEYSAPTWSRLSPELTRALRKAARGLEPKPASRLGRLKAPEARVDEVVPPPRPSASGNNGSGAPVVALGAGGLAALLAGGLLFARRRRHGSEPSPA